ncbi:mucin-2 [Danio aesculapii]|uniref:mucin-2 n=1 Tax=Danio aesculapii TaxID=1142201 RepID=UPI0024C0DF25|nr:mucin-2 [Danio aesculapii]
MRTQNAFIVWTAMVLHLSVLKGQRTDSFTDGTPTLNEVLPEYQTTPKSDSQPGTGDLIVSSPPTDLSSFEVTANVSPSQSSRDAAVQNDTSHSQTTTLNMDTASVPGFSVSSTALSYLKSTISDSEASTAPTSISPSEGHQSVNTSASSVSQITQTAPPITPTYPQTSQLTLTSSLKSTGPGLEDQDEPSELDVGDQESGKVQHRPASPLDPLLAALVTIFIICTAMVSAVLFLRFRQRSEHPEFHRLQDLPMDDLLEDTPLSRYTY